MARNTEIMRAASLVQLACAGIVFLYTAAFAIQAEGAMASWTQRGADAGHSGYVGGVMSLDPQQTAPAWVATLGYDQSAVGSWSERAVATDGVNVYRVALSGYSFSGDYHVQAFDLHTGASVWDTVIKGNAFAGVGEPTVAMGKVWVNRAGHSSNSTYDELPKLYALDADDGHIVSATTYSAQWGENDRPTADGTLLVAQAGYYGGMSGYNANDGSTTWYTQGTQSTSPGAVLSDQYLFAYGDNVYSRNTGRYIRSVTHPTGKYLRRPSLSPGGTLLYTTMNGIAAFDADTLDFLWDVDLGEYVRSTASGNGKVVVATAGWVRIYDEQTGAELHSLYSQKGFGEIALTDSHAFVNNVGETLAIDLATGTEAWRVSDSGEMALSNGYLLLSDHAGIRAYAVPEPVGMALMGLGLLAVVQRR